MNQIRELLSLRCPDHENHLIGMLDGEPDAKKIGYCYECIEKSILNGSDIQAVKSVSNYLKDKSSFYEQWRSKVSHVEHTPVEFAEEFSKKGERLKKFSQHIEQQNNKVRNRFAEIRKIVLQIIAQKEKECLELLDKELQDLSELYEEYEKLLMMGWPKSSDIPNLYPELDILKQKISQIESMDQLRTFMTAIQEDANLYDLYFKKDDSLSKIKKKIDGLVQCLSIPDSSFPEIKVEILNLKKPENFMRDLIKKFIQQEIKVQNSIESRTNVLNYESKIISEGQFITLKDWLPEGYKFDIKLLYRGSEDGMSAQKFHEKCDGKGATITLIKCRHDGAGSSNILGGFIDQSWHSKGSYSNSKEAFLFSLAEQRSNSVKCPILESKCQHAVYGHSSYGPLFGGGFDLYVSQDFKTVTIASHSYSNTIALQNGYGREFNLQEVEIYQVL